MSDFSKIKLSDLPSPELIKELTVDEIYSEAKTYFKTNFPDYAEAIEFESEPITALMQSFSYREANHRAYVNQAVKASLLAFSNGPDLDHLAALVPLKRNLGETNDNFRARVQLAPEGFSTAGPAGAYEFFTKGVSAEILEVYVGEPEPGFIDIYIFQSVPITLERLAAVKARLEPVRPLGDDVSVLAYVSSGFNVAAVLTLADGYSAADVLPAAEASARAYLETRQTFGKAVYKNALAAAMQIEGVENVNLSEPLADITPPANSVASLLDFAISEASDV